MPGMIVALTLDTSGLTTAITGFMGDLFPWAIIAIGILGPVMVIGLGFAFGKNILGMLAGVFKGMGGK